MIILTWNILASEWIKKSHYPGIDESVLFDYTARFSKISEKIKSINGYTFEYDLENKDLTYIPKLGKDIGVLAQEIEQVIPEAVSIAPIDRNEEGKSKSGKNYLTVNYEKIIPLLIQGIKEQQSQIEALKLLIK